jgi:8-oxo-dGTP pyrophosphatase MutT (NUDIX family)
MARQDPAALVDDDLTLRPDTGGPEGVVFDVLLGGRTAGQVGVRRTGDDVGLLQWHLDDDTDPEVAVRATRLLLGHEFGSSGLQRIEAHVDPDDVRMHRMLARSGLRREGVLRGHAAAGEERADRVLMARLVSDPAADSRDGFIAMLNAGLPRKRVISQLVVRDPDDRVLLCELTYKHEWDLPGGVVEPLESPATGLARELREELGLDLPVGDLLTVNWLPPWRGWDDACLFVFDGGTLPADATGRMRLQPTEIAAVHWCTPELVAERATAATRRLLDALADPGRRGSYLEDAAPPPEASP